MEIRKPTNWLNAKGMLDKTLQARSTVITEALGRIMFNLLNAAEEGKFATTINLREDTKIITQILEEAGYKVQFLKPNGEYSQYIVCWEKEDEE
jgi:hypothetical protein